MSNKNLLTIVFLLSISNLSAQLLLDADGPGMTYELITSKLAPNHNPIEVPDCGHTAFGRHIDEVFDNDLNAYVFRFHIHQLEDDDRCINFDRQRNEIKTYDKSPDSLLGVVGEIFEYKWKFKLDAGFQSSPKFTHIHQLKAVGGSESSMPLITLTTRASNPDELELRYAETTTQTTLHEVDLAPFKGVWCEATETVLYGENGTYDIEIKRVSDGVSLFSYSDNDIRMWKTDADFVRPKWGIYRSLNFVNDLRDEEVLFANFSIYENPAAPLPIELTFFEGRKDGTNVLLNWQTAAEMNHKGFEVQKSSDSFSWNDIGFIAGQGDGTTLRSYEFTDTNPFNGINYYRLKLIDLDNRVSYTDTVVVQIAKVNGDIQIAPNPIAQTINIQGMTNDAPFEIYDTTGKSILKGSTSNLQIDASKLAKGVYILQINSLNDQFIKKIVKE